MTVTKTCVTCNNDAGIVGWSMCDSCFRADRFNGLGYWSLRITVAVMLAVAVGFLMAAVVVLTS